MSYQCIIFDCDGVLVDSERISAQVFQQMASELGFVMDFETALKQFSGASMNDNLAFMAANIDGELPVDFESQFRQRTYEAFKTDTQPVEGVKPLIDKLHVPYCVASSGPIEKICLNLTTVGLIDKFEGKIFSAYDIGSWKPSPDIFLHAARSMGFAPEECIVVEDSVSGIKAAVNGGFKVYALGNKDERKVFEELGAIVFYHMDELSELLNLES